MASHHHRDLTIVVTIALVIGAVAIGALALTGQDSEDGAASDELAAGVHSERAAAFQLGRLRVAPGGKQFGDQPVGTTSAPFTFTLSHDSPDTAAGDVRVRLAGAPTFVLGNDQCSGKRLFPGQTCTFNITSAPKWTGSLPGQINIVASGGFLHVRVDISSRGV
jgi:hypothetical protein